MMKTLLAILLLILLIAPRAWAAPAFQVAGSTSGDTVTSLNFSLNVAGSDRFLYACVYDNKTGTITSVTYNGVGLTLLETFDTGSGLLSVYKLVAPGTGNNTFQVNWDNSVVAVIGAVQYTAVDQTTPHGTTVETGGTILDDDATVNVSSATGELVTGCMGMFTDAETPTAGPDQTERINLVASGIATLLASDEAGAATVTHSYVWNDNFYETAIIATPLKPASGGSPTGGRPRMIIVE